VPKQHLRQNLQKKFVSGNFSSRAPVRQGRTRKLKEKGDDGSEEHQVTHERRF
jgi:hypothetical protein